MKLDILTAENTIQQNYEFWSSYNWSNEGREWCHSDEWAKSVVQYIMLPELRRKKRCLEIGAGGGFWSMFLVRLVTELTLVDIVPACIDICKRKLEGHAHVRYYCNDGQSLNFAEDQTMDAIWSWNTFVHINEQNITTYFREFKRILMPGGVAIIHHARKGATKAHNGWRSNITDEKIREIAKRSGLTVVKQLQAWGPNQAYKLWPNLPVDESNDSISIIRNEV